ncbi:MAG TPA: FHA domain-containing protein, partial [Vicinamibacteria bacterium]|nr:FHA domain-containing protein [Vicinamibacteria bacterium]
MGESSSPQPSLTVLGGPMAGQRLLLDDAVANLLIGSDPSCDLYLPHDNVSPIHARLWMDLEGAVLHDTNSPHGVYVNDERVAGQHPLRNGDIVWLGPPGGAGAVMIQCVLPEHAAEVEAPPKAAPADTDEQETLDALAPTMAAAPSFADLDDRPPDAEPPDWDLEPPPVPTSAPETDLEEVSRTQAFKRPADFAAALAAAPRSAPPPPPDEPSASLPPGAARPDELDHLFSEHVAAPREDPILEPQAYVVEPEATIVEPEATIIDSAPVFAEAEPVSTDTEPYLGDPQAAFAEPEVIEAYLPEPEATLVMPSGGATAPPPVASGALAGEPPAEFDDMMFTVPDEPPLIPAPPAPAAASPPPAAATTPAEAP